MVVLEAFTITELGVALVGVLGALVVVLRVSACKYISCGLWKGCKCERAKEYDNPQKKTESVDLEDINLTKDKWES